MRKLILLCLLIFTMTANAQELSCRVTVNTQRINQTNQRAFVTLQRALQEFVNKTQWTDIKARENERINCSFVLTLSSYENNNFKADLQVQASRPVYGSTYPTPLINYQEKDISFSYLENEPIYFNPNTFTSNLSSIIAYYALIIIGLDADTFAPNGGNPYFEQALAVVLNAQSSSDSAWQQNGSNNRWQMVTDLLAEDFAGFHKALYTYLRLGLDLMAQDIQEGKNQIGAALLELNQINNSRINRFVSQLFFDAKADEISQLLSGGKPLDKKEEVRAVLLKLAPTRAQEWNQIK